MTTDEWRPTHVVYQPTGRFYPVMLEPASYGVEWARTLAEYNAHRAAALELVEGTWHYNGEPFAGAVTPIPSEPWVNALHSLAVELAECEAWQR